MSTRREREEKERIKYQKILDMRVEAVVRNIEKTGKTVSEFDKMRIRAFEDERNISDNELNIIEEKICKLEQEIEKNEKST